MATDTRPEPEPLKTNDLHVAAAGTAAWAVAFFALLIVGLPADDRWWLWVCVTGVSIGLFACWYTPRLQRARAADEEDRTARD